MADPNATAAPDVFPVPRPDLTPGDVVRTQVEALAENDLPHQDAGIETAFRFMAPDTRQQIGSIRHFIDVVNNPIYRCSIKHRRVRYSEVRVRGRHALRALILTPAHSDQEVGFVFALERQQSPPHRHCWMTTSVRRVQV
jgi:hypothetical protein